MREEANDNAPRTEYNEGEDDPLLVRHPKYVEHKDYGRQFKVETFEKLMPETLGALEKYLANGSIKGIGEAKKKALLKHFGSVEKIRKSSVEELTKVNGINESLAKKKLDFTNGENFSW